MTASMWLPGAKVMASSHDAGAMTGNDCYATWHTYETNYTTSATAGAASLIRAGNEVHLCFNPVSGEVVQMLPANRAARGLLNAAGGVETNRQGKYNIQVEVIAWAAHPWTNDLTAAGAATLKRIVSWMDSLGIPRTSPNGYIGPGPNGPFNRSVTGWNGPGGHFCHGQVPENFHWDHGKTDIRDIWAAAPITTQDWFDMATQADLEAAVLKVLKSAEGRNAVASATWTADGILNAPARTVERDSAGNVANTSPAQNEYWVAESFIRSLDLQNYNNTVALGKLLANDAAQTAVLNLLKSGGSDLTPEDVQEAVRKAIDEKISDVEVTLTAAPSDPVQGKA